MGPEFTENQIDVLKELVSIGAGNAATALSALLRQKVTIVVPRVHLVRVDKAKEVFGIEEQLVVAVYIEMTRDIAGALFISFLENQAKKLAGILLDKKEEEIVIEDAMVRSALEETVGILSGSYLTALAKLLHKRCYMSFPLLACDMAGAVVDTILIQIGQEADYAIVVETEFTMPHEKIEAYFFFVPSRESLREVLASLNAG